MGWDASRPVPWRRLTREWMIYAGIMAVVFGVFLRGDPWAIAVGLLASGPLYLGLGYVLAKFGHQRKTLAELRTARTASSAPTAVTTADRVRPAPTRRTSTGRNRPSPGRRR